MNILIIPDSFKGSLSAKEVSFSIKKGIEKARGSQDKITMLPFSDGGEGFLDTIAPILNAEMITKETVNPLGEKINAQYGWVEHSKTGIIEFAQASGLTLIKELKPLIATSYGTGIQLKELINKGAQKIIIGLGGSATNDGGLGLCRALGIKFLDDENQEINTPNNLSRLQQIDISEIKKISKNVELIFACDVTNPLTGPNGATTVFGPQKGVDSNSHSILESGLKHLSEILKSQFKIDVNTIEGSGAAGGANVILQCFLKSSIISGFKLLANEYNLPELIKKSDLVITGEGCSDTQSFNGKLIGNLTDMCGIYNKNLVIICGESKVDPKKDNIKILNITSKNTTKTESLLHTKTYVEKKIYDFLIV